MSRAAKKATISGEFGAASPTLDLQDGAAGIAPQRSLEMSAELFD
jgi:hypothetical protein